MSNTAATSQNYIEVSQYPLDNRVSGITRLALYGTNKNFPIVKTVKSLFG